MLKVTSLTARNFLSIGNVTQSLKLDENGLTLMLGANADAQGGLSKNGAGKSSIIQALSFALFGKPLTRIKIPNLVNNINTKGMYVTVDFERDGVGYRIERGRKPDVMKFLVDGVEQKNDDSEGENRHTQVNIEAALGMSHDLFKQIVALNTFTQPFLELDNAKQKIIIEELFTLTQMAQRAEVLGKLIKRTREELRDGEASLKAVREANDRIASTISHVETKRSDWNSTHEATLARLMDELDEIEALDFDAELAKFDALEAFNTAEREITGEIETMRRELSHLEREIVREEKEATRLVEEAQRGSEQHIARFAADIERKSKEHQRHETAALQHIAAAMKVEHDMENPDTQSCVCCGQDLRGTQHLETVVAALRGQMEASRTKALDERARAEEIIGEISQLGRERDALVGEDFARKMHAEERAEAHRTAAARLREDVALQSDSIVSLQDGVTALGDRPRVAFRSRDEVYRTKQAREAIERDLDREAQALNPFDAQIDDLRATLQIVDPEPVEAKAAFLKHQEFLFKLLTSKDSFIRKRVVEQNLSFLNSRVHYYLEKLGLPHEVRFLNDLTVDIMHLGRDYDYEQLSRGERNRVIMAISWSFRDVWESMNTNLNLMFVDELIDNGLDPQGVEVALAILKSLARDRAKNVFLISHREELMGRVENVLTVRKDNGFTTIEVGGEVAEA